MEYLDIVTEDGIPTGRTAARDEVHREGLLHRTAHVWIARKRNGVWQVLLQKRSMEKESFPGMFDTSSAGHIPAGEDPLPSALRELYEELGVQAGPEDLNYIGTFRVRYEKEFHGKIFRDNEVTSVYLCRKRVDEDTLVLQREEVEEVCWFDLQEIRQEIQSSRRRFCVPRGGLELLSRFLQENENTQREWRE